MKPRRVQLRRVKGWRMPPNTNVVARPSIYGNPFKAADYGQEKAVSMFQSWILARENKDLRERAINALRGKNLACWCKPGTPCHADIWLELVNQR